MKRARAGVVGPIVRAGALAAGVLAGGAVEAAGQRLAVLEEPWGQAVGVAVVVGGGEDAAPGGMLRLLAGSIVEEARLELGLLGGSVGVQCDDDVVRFGLVFPPSTWRAGTEYFLRVLLAGEAGTAAVERAKAELLRELAVERGNPAAEAVVALGRARFGAGWEADAPCGAAEAIRTVAAADVQSAARTLLYPGRTTIAVAGPVDRGEVAEVVDRELGKSDLPVLRSGGRGRGGIGWEFVRRNAVSAWVLVAFPVEAEADREALGLLAHVAARSFAPSPARRDIFDAAARYEQAGGGAVVVQLVTATDAAERRADDVVALVRRLAADPLEEAAFRSHLRAYRGERLLALETPEARAADAALQLYHTGDYTAPARALETLGPDRLRRAAAALGPPARAFLGPP